MTKSILLVTFLLALGTSITSCKKDYVCKCSKTYTSGSGTTTHDYSQYTFKDTRAKAETRCNEKADTGSDFFGSYSINCQIQ